MQNSKTNSGKKKLRQQAKSPSAKRTKSPAADRQKLSAADAQNMRRANAPIHACNPRRIVHSKAYNYFIAALLILLGAALFLVLFTFTQEDLLPEAETALNLFGIIGAHIADVMLTLFGLSAFLFSAECMMLGTCTIFGRTLDVKPSMLVGLVLLIFGSAPLSTLAFGEMQILDHQAGGIVGSALIGLASSYISNAAFIAICLCACLLGALFVTDTKLKDFFCGLFLLIKKFFSAIGHGIASSVKSSFAKTPANAQESPVTPASEQSEMNIYEEETPSELLDVSVYEPKALPVKQAHSKEEEKNIIDHLENSIDSEFSNEMSSENAHENADDENKEEAVSRLQPASSADAESSDEVNASEQTDEKASKAQETAGNLPQPEANDAPKTEAFGDIMAKILNIGGKKSPKGRSLRRSHSVPALEPEFDFDSIVAPEIIAKPSAAPAAAAADANPTELPAASSVLGAWKPRAIGHKANARPAAENVQMPTVALSAETACLQANPPNMTRDLIAQLSGEDSILEQPKNISDDLGNVTRVADNAQCAGIDGTRQKSSDTALGGGAAMQQKLIEMMNVDASDAEKSALQNTIAAENNDKKAIFADINKNSNDDDLRCAIDNIIKAHKNEKSVSPQTVMQKSANTAKLNACTNCAETDYQQNIYREKETENGSIKRTEQSQNTNISQMTKDGLDAINQIMNHQIMNHQPQDAKRETAAAYSAMPNHPDTPNSFIIAEEKKRASEGELADADRERLKKIDTAIEYHHPPLSLLHYDPAAQKGFDLQALRDYANRIEEKLLEYHVDGKVVQICPGPVITRFEYQPAPGTKVSKIAGLSRDLMMALAIESIRILAPIPGKNVVGIEIPNDNRNIIYLKEIIGSKPFIDAKSKLTIALGKDSEGEPVVTDLAKAPHLLVAGATGSGKSVGVNTMICSLLYNASPDEVKLILVDPKCLELSIYEGIPHLLVPPITSARETNSALEWACDEMDDRYRKLAAFGVRNIGGYNEQLKNPTLPKAMEQVKLCDDSGNPLYRPMPYIVIVVDEFADLIMASDCGKDIEKSIARLAQKARAAGIHIILATQRPSTNVITGTIKANFPTRIAFRVTAYVDSRTILDQAGAENLLGYGDSLFLPPNGSVLQRVHGAYVSDEEVQAIVTFLACQRKPEYNMEITAPRDEDNEEPAASACDDDGLDARYDEAVRIVAETQQASASFLQRRMSIGFNRAARIIEQMEREGVIGPQRGQKPREVLIAPI